MWEKNLWFRMVYNKFETPENIEEMKDEEASFEDALRFNFVELINQMDWLRTDTEDKDQARLCSIAISKLEEACMFCVKAATYDK